MSAADALWDAIQRAASELPDCYTVAIDVERGAATVSMLDPVGGRESIDVDGDNRLVAEIHAAVDKAITHAASVSASPTTTTKGTT